MIFLTVNDYKLTGSHKIRLIGTLIKSLRRPTLFFRVNDNKLVVVTVDMKNVDNSR